MSRDSELGKYNHRYVQNHKDEQDIDCLICGQEFDEHIDVILGRKDDPKKKNTKENQTKDEKLLIKENLKITNNIKTIHFDKETIDFLENTNLCKICYTREIDQKDPKMKFACGDRFCKECVVRYLKMNIFNGNVFMIINCRY